MQVRFRSVHGGRGRIAVTVERMVGIQWERYRRLRVEALVEGFDVVVAARVIVARSLQALDTNNLLSHHQRTGLRVSRRDLHQLLQAVEERKDRSLIAFSRVFAVIGRQRCLFVLMVGIML